ncbi:MAG TPA: transporter associated domain-containing protein [Edaphocola sp.]|nr:transporter associated domain-containing protein [Edaphocola sp.]
MIIFNQIFLLAAPSSISVLVILLLFVLFLASIAAGAEVGFFSLKMKDIDELKTKDDTNSRLIISILEDAELLLASLRVSKYSLSILFIFLFNFLANSVKDETLNPFVFKLSALLIGLIILLLFIEVLPKVYSKYSNIKMTAFSVPVVNVLYLTFKGVSQFWVDSEKDKEEKRTKSLLYWDNLKDLENVLEANIGRPATKEEVEIFKGVLKFGNVSVKQIMVPRIDIIAVRESWDAKKMKEKILESSQSRLPVYSNNIDEIIGVIHAKDVIPYLDENHFDWHTLIRPAYFIHQHKLINDLLNDFKKGKVHFAVVVDEFGGTAGIITLGDLMQEIVGDIKDEFDEQAFNFRRINDNAFIFEGRMLINDMCRIMDTPLGVFADARGESDSVAGLVLELAGKFPKVNEIISYEQFDFTVLSVDKLRIEKVKVEFE